MGLRVIDVALDGGPTAGVVGDALRQLGCRSDEEWAIEVRSGAGGCELFVRGPARTRSSAEWQVGVTLEGAWYRRVLRGTDQRHPEFIRRLVRDLIWEPVHFAENPITHEGSRLGDEFEQAVLAVLCDEEPEPLDVRFSVWRGDPSGLRFLCKIECGPTAHFDAEPAWRWWSPLVATPDELATRLREALLSRGRLRRRVVRPPSRAVDSRWGFAESAPWSAPPPSLQASAGTRPRRDAL